MDVGGDDGMTMPYDALAARMTRWAVGGRQSHPLISLSASHCAVMTGRKDSAFWSRVATSLRTPMSP